MISFVIPVLNEGGTISGLLTQLRRNFPRAELIVVDGGSADDTVKRALTLADAVLQGPAGRAAQMNLGAGGARGEWLFFLHADSQPQFDGRELEPYLGGSDSWGFFSIRLLGRSRALGLISWFINRRSQLTSVATGDQGLLLRRELFLELQGFAELPLMEDVEFSKRLRRKAKPLRLPLQISSSGRRWDEQGVVNTVLRMWVLRFFYWCGVSPQRLWRHYYGPKALGVRSGADQHHD